MVSGRLCCTRLGVLVRRGVLFYTRLGVLHPIINVAERSVGYKQGALFPSLAKDYLKNTPRCSMDDVVMGVLHVLFDQSFDFIKIGHLDFLS